MFVGSELCLGPSADGKVKLLGTKVCDVIEIAKQRANCICSHTALALGRLLLPAYLCKQISFLAQETAEQDCCRSSCCIAFYFSQLKQVLNPRNDFSATFRSACNLCECQQTSARAGLILLLFPLQCCNISTAQSSPYVTDLSSQQHFEVVLKQSG